MAPVLLLARRRARAASHSSHAWHMHSDVDQKRLLGILGYPGIHYFITFWLDDISTQRVRTCYIHVGLESANISNDPKPPFWGPSSHKHTDFWRISAFIPWHNTAVFSMVPIGGSSCTPTDWNYSAVGTEVHETESASRMQRRTRNVDSKRPVSSWLYYNPPTTFPAPTVLSTFPFTILIPHVGGGKEEWEWEGYRTKLWSRLPVPWRLGSS